MLRHFFAVPALGRVLLAGSLCLLAFAFAMEAKMAWYGPALGPAQDICAAKALPADTPALALQRAHIGDSLSQQFSLTWLPAFAAILIAATGAMAAAGASETRLLARNPVPVSCRPHFSPLLFFRPPPAL
jgi:hypothetical protein